MKGLEIKTEKGVEKWKGKIEIITIEIRGKGKGPGEKLSFSASVPI